MPATVFRRELCRARLAAVDAAEALSILARGLLDAGCVRPSFEAALLAREAESPTGLPLAGRKAALPHSDPEHVLAAAIAVATLVRPVLFREMGNPEQQLPVEVIAVLALPDHESAQRELVRLVERFQDPRFVDALCGAGDGPALYQLLVEEAPR